MKIKYVQITNRYYHKHQEEKRRCANDFKRLFEMEDGWVASIEYRARAHTDLSLSPIRKVETNYLAIPYKEHALTSIPDSYLTSCGLQGYRESCSYRKERVWSTYLFFKLCYICFQLLVPLSEVLYLSLKRFHINGLRRAPVKVLLQKPEAYKKLYCHTRQKSLHSL